MVLAIALGGLADVPVAFAGGVEFPSAGTRAVGRGGAAAARADDPMTLAFNPAGLARTPGIQLSLQTHLMFYSACFQRSGTYDAYAAPMPDRATILAEGGLYRYDLQAAGNTSRTPSVAPQDGSRFDSRSLDGVALPEVCNSGPPGVVPNLILTARIAPKWGISFGIVAPAAVSHTRWGSGSDGLVNGLPSPARYNLLESQLLVAYPTVGVAYRPHPAISIGASFGWGVAPQIDFTTITRAVRGEEFQNDIYTELSAQDWFIPRLNFSIHAVPHDNIDIVAGFMWQDDIRAEGDLTLTSGYYRSEPVDQLTIPTTQIDAPQPWQATLAFRYADRIKPRILDPDTESRLTGRVEDSMQNERWDIELDMVYEINRRVDEFTVSMPRCTGDSCMGSLWAIEVDDGFTAGVPRSLVLPHQWQDQLSLRLGGDWNFLPGVGTARLGVSYETKGVKDGFEQLDFLPLQRFGIHAGITFRIAKRFDISVAYAHIFQSAVTVREDQASLHQPNASQRIGELACQDDPDCDATDRQNIQGGAGGEGTLVNAGRYNSNLDIFSLGLTYHFR
ncbi:MAG: hypothetical protein CMN30_10405 [Sandaracinus sp.]|nr:hypothetical protein [Sandaracinus sp.]